MPTTVTISTRTKTRLAGYKHGDMTYDDVLNNLMDEVDVEDVSTEQIAEHFRRLAEGDFIPAKEFLSRKKRKNPEKTSRRHAVRSPRVAARSKGSRRSPGARR